MRVVYECHKRCMPVSHILFVLTQMLLLFREFKNSADFTLQHRGRRRVERVVSILVSPEGVYHRHLFIERVGRTSEQPEEAGH